MLRRHVSRKFSPLFSAPSRTVIRDFSACPITGGFTDSTRKVLKDTIPAVAAAGQAFTEHFYKRLLGAHPALKGVFNMTNQVTQKQSGKLFGAVAGAAVEASERNRHLLEHTLEAICHKHVALNVQPEQYNVVAEHIVGTIKDLLTKDEKILAGWVELYGTVAGDMIAMEKKLYAEAQGTIGGWVGQREFEIAGRKAVSSTISRITFKPTDGKPVSGFKSGQYTTVWLHPPGWEHGQPRHYTLAVPLDPLTYSKQYEISVKKQGKVSDILHEAPIGSKVKLSPPMGAFLFSNAEQLWGNDNPVVFLTVGVGITPCLAMLESVQSDGCLRDRKITWLHGSRSGSVHAYRPRLIALGSNMPHLTRRVWYTQPVEEDGTPEPNNNLAKFHFEGRMKLDQVKPLLHLDSNAHYFVCGPPEFEQDVRDFLAKAGVSSDRVLFESF